MPIFKISVYAKNKSYCRNVFQLTDVLLQLMLDKL